MVEKVKVTKNGGTKDIETKYGTKQKTGIQVDKYGDKWLSTFSKSGSFIKEGDEIYIKVEENGEYYNFKFASVADAFDMLFEMRGSDGAKTPTALNETVDTPSKVEEDGLEDW